MFLTGEWYHTCPKKKHHVSVNPTPTLTPCDPTTAIFELRIIICYGGLIKLKN
jgi:hypothetical protein